MSSKVAPEPGSAALSPSSTTGDLSPPQPSRDAAPSSGGVGGGGGCWICSSVANDVVTGVHEGIEGAKELGNLSAKSISDLILEDEEEEKQRVESLFMMQVGGAAEAHGPRSTQ